MLFLFFFGLTKYAFFRFLMSKLFSRFAVFFVLRFTKIHQNVVFFWLPTDVWQKLKRSLSSEDADFACEPPAFCPSHVQTQRVLRGVWGCFRGWALSKRLRLVGCSNIRVTHKSYLIYFCEVHCLPYDLLRMSKLSWCLSRLREESPFMVTFVPSNIIG